VEEPNPESYITDIDERVNFSKFPNRGTVKLY